MACITEPFKTSVGKKAVMAVTGLLLVGFIFGHLVGNLLIYLGQETFNNYAAFLQGLGELLWVMRGALLIAVVLHILFAIKVSAENRAARPEAYAVKKSSEATYASRTMMMSGLIIFAFIIYHLLHFTARVTNPDISHAMDELGRHDTYSMVIRSFQIPLISGAYIVAMILLGTHLSHGLSSMLQSLGWNNKETKKTFKRAGQIIAALIFTGFASIPVSVLLGILKLPAGGHS